MSKAFSVILARDSGIPRAAARSFGAASGQARGNDSKGSRAKNPGLCLLLVQVLSIRQTRPLPSARFCPAIEALPQGTAPQIWLTDSRGHFSLIPQSPPGKAERAIAKCATCRPFIPNSTELAAPLQALGDILHRKPSEDQL
jgi:hypothetical protein